MTFSSVFKLNCSIQRALFSWDLKLIQLENISPGRLQVLIYFQCCFVFPLLPYNFAFRLERKCLLLPSEGCQKIYAHLWPQFLLSRLSSWNWGENTGRENELPSLICKYPVEWLISFRSRSELAISTLNAAIPMPWHICLRWRQTGRPHVTKES